METQENQAITAPPKLIPSCMAGFNSVAGNIRLIILPIVLDLFLWFAPRVSIKSLVDPILNQYLTQLSSSNLTDVQQIVSSNQIILEESLTRFNLLSTLRTLPIGVPSLLSGRGVITNPIGAPVEVDLTSLGATLALWLLFALIGIGTGSLFYGEIARISMDLKGNFSFRRSLKMFRNTLYLTLSFYALLLLISIPAVILIAIISLINPVFSQISIIFVFLVLIWLLMPLIFSPHGIYGSDQNVFTSAINSIRLVRYFLPETGLFILMGMLISQGMDVLWTFPAEDSWMVVIGIFGHAFITTGVIASSFIYYRGGVQWMNEKMQRMTGKTQISLDKQ